MLCSSGFVDDVMFSINGVTGPESMTTLFFVEFARWQQQLDIRQTLCLVEFVTG